MMIERQRLTLAKDLTTKRQIVNPQTVRFTFFPKSISILINQ
jgi:hypothetical protein